MIGVFVSLDLLVFYLFFEASLVPMFFLIGIWGGENRIYAAVKFFIFTALGSLLMLVAIIALVLHTRRMQTGVGTFDYVALMNDDEVGKSELYRSTRQTGTLLFLAFAIAFAIKVPLFPFHTWLPDAHTEAPTAGSVILAAVLLKMGTYGLMRFNFTLFPDQSRDFAPIFIVLAIIGIIYGALVAMVQPDVKRLVAYSSVAHMGFVILGMFSFTELGNAGRALPDAQSRRLDRRVVPARRVHLRAASHATDLRFRRPRERDADLRDDFCDHSRCRRSACRF